MKSCLPVLLLLFALPATARAWTKQGSTYTTDGSQADVQAALNVADPGDTVVVLAGVHRWKRVEITTPVTLTGVGNGESGTDTIIRDDNDPGDNNAIVLNLNTLAGGFYRLTNIRWQMGADSGRKGKAHLAVGGNSHSIRIDGNYFDDIKTSPVVRFSDSTAGCFDGNVFFVESGSPTLTWGYQSTWPNGTGEDGDGSWTDPVAYGDGLAWYIEGNELINKSGERIAFSDTYAGCRLVYRYNKLEDGNFPTHGTGDGSGRARGPRRLEIYKNTITIKNSSPSSNSCHIRGGAGIFFANHHVGGTKGITFHHYRFDKPHGKFGFIDGVVPWDQPYLNDGSATPGGAGDGVFESGVATVGTRSSVEWTNPAGFTGSYYTLKDSTKNWVPDQWRGYTLRAWVNATDSRIARSGHPSGLAYPEGTLGTIIHGNDTNTLYLAGDNQPLYAEVRVSAGRPYEIRRIKYALDQVGMGRSDDMVDKSSYPTAQVINQEFDGFYVWGNSFSDAKASNGVGEPGTEHNVHFFNEVAGYNGSDGMGVGLLAQRPERPTLRYTAYYATDEVYAGRVPGVLYRWNGERWEYWWSEFQYPHPLRSVDGASSRPVIPRRYKVSER